MSWLDRMLEFRDRLLSNPDFHRFAAGFPPTRAIARRRARAVFDLCAGFVYSQILHACVKLGILEKLRAGPASLGALADETGLSEARIRQLLDAAATLGLVMRRGEDRYGLGMHGAAMLGNPGILRMIEHHELFYSDLADPVGLLRDDKRETALGRYWAYARGADRLTLADADIDAYTRLMSGSQTLVASEILDCLPLERYHTLLDVGGGDGTFLEAVGRRYPHLGLMLFDLPAVAARAERRLASAGLAARARITGGDFLSGDLPRGADLVSLVRVLHDHSDEGARRILHAARRALPPNGSILIAEPLADTAGAEAMGAAYFGFYLMAMGSGRPRTLGEVARLLLDAGFSQPNRIETRLPLQTSVILAVCRQ